MRTINTTLSGLGKLNGRTFAELGKDLPGLGGFGLPGADALRRDAPASNRLTPTPGFGTNPGALKGYTYVPPGLPAGAPLVVVLHGCKQDAAGYDHHSGWSRLADEAGFALLYPEQQPANNPNHCFNWFRPRDMKRDAGEALSIRQMIEATLIAHRLDRSRVFITGLSAGGAMTSVMLATYPEVFAGGAIIAGLAYGRATSVPEAFDCMRGRAPGSDEDLWALLHEASHYAGPWPRITIWQGSADQTVAPSNADEIAAQWRSVHRLPAAPTRTEVDGGRARQLWCGPDGEPVIELNTVAAMGHGTPLGEGLGTPGPYMLDVGISSSREIARFWHIAGPAPRREQTQRSAAATPPRTPRENGPRGGTAGAEKTTRTKAGGLRGVIEDALRAAGLMR